MEGLAALTNFLADKDITVGCPYFWSVHYEVLTELPEMPTFPQELCKFKLLSRGVIADVSEAPAYQKARLLDMLTSKLQQTLSTSDLITGLDTRLVPFSGEEASQFIEPALLQQSADFKMLLAQSPCLDRKEVDALESLIGKVTEPAEDVKQTLLSVLLYFKQPAKQIIEHAATVCSASRERLQQYEDMKAASESLAKILEKEAATEEDFKKALEVTSWSSRLASSLGDIGGGAGQQLGAHHGPREGVAFPRCLRNRCLVQALCRQTELGGSRLRAVPDGAE